jgi:long-chain fatty acid transport protein
MLRTITFLFLLPTCALAGGFAVGAQSAEALGQASAVTAKPSSSSAAFYNPSAVTDEQGPRLYAGMLLLGSSFDLNDTSGQHGTTRVRPPPTTPPHLFFDYVNGKAGASLYVGVPFGSGLSYDDAWHGRYQVTQVGITTLAVNPNAVYRPLPWLSVGAGIQYLRGTFELRRKADLVSSDVGIHLAGAASAFSLTGSATVDVRDDLRLALTYRGGAPLRFNGGVDFTEVPVPFQERLRDQDIQVRLTLPDRVALGAHYAPLERLAVRLDLEYYRWSSFQSLDLYFQDDPSLDVSIPRLWRDAVTVRVGGEYQVLEWLTARTGLLFDPAVSPTHTLSPASPDANRLGLAAGVSATHGRLTGDIGYLYLQFLGRASAGEAYPLHYQGRVHAAALSVRYRFGG